MYYKNTSKHIFGFINTVPDEQQPLSRINRGILVNTVPFSDPLLTTTRREREGR